LEYTEKSKKKKDVAVGEMVKPPDLHSGDCEFESRPRYQNFRSKKEKVVDKERSIQYNQVEVHRRLRYFEKQLFDNQVLNVFSPCLSGPWNKEMDVQG